MLFIFQSSIIAFRKRLKYDTTKESCCQAFFDKFFKNFRHTKYCGIYNVVILFIDFDFKKTLL